MKKILISLILFLFPAFALADSVSISPLTITQCGYQQVPLGGTASYSNGNNYLEVFVDGVLDDTSTAQNPTWSFPEYVDVGSHSFTAEVLSSSNVVLSSTLDSIVINSCPVSQTTSSSGTIRHGGGTIANVVFINGILYASHILTKEQLIQGVESGAIKGYN